MRYLLLIFGLIFLFMSCSNTPDFPQNTTDTVSEYEGDIETDSADTWQTTITDNYCKDSSECHTCLIGAECVENKCVGGVAISCDDNNSCTDDSCAINPYANQHYYGNGCGHTANPDPCDDGYFCTENDRCAEKMCQGTYVEGSDICDDNNTCTLDYCDSNKDQCMHVNLADGHQCNKNCTNNGTCQSGICDVDIKVDHCNDDNPCTIDSCQSPYDEFGGWCEHKSLSNGTPCDDNNACTLGDHCQCADEECDTWSYYVGCVGETEKTNADCADDDPCTEDRCESAFGCTHEPMKFYENCIPTDSKYTKLFDKDCNWFTCGSGECLPSIDHAINFAANTWGVEASQAIEDTPEWRAMLFSGCIIPELHTWIDEENKHQEQCKLGYTKENPYYSTCTPVYCTNMNEIDFLPEETGHCKTIAANTWYNDGLSVLQNCWAGCFKGTY